MNGFKNLPVARKLAVAFSITTIVASMQRVTDIMSEISTASQEQCSGIKEVNLTITHMDQATQQNAALVEEATAAARSMEEQAVELSQAVSIFRIDAHVASAKRAHQAVPSVKARALAYATLHMPSQPRAERGPRHSNAALAEAGWQEF